MGIATRSESETDVAKNREIPASLPIMPSSSSSSSSPDQPPSSSSSSPLLLPSGHPHPPLVSSPSSASLPRQCRICLLGTDTRRRPLISPCRCAGSVRHVHTHCLAHWIEVQSRKLPPVPQCELCGYHYRRRAFVDITRLHFPFMELSDRVLNAICLLLVAIMVLCAWVAVHHLSLAERRMAAATVAVASRSSAGTASRASSRAPSSASVGLSDPDLTVLFAVLLFFCALFLALFTQYRAGLSVCRALSRCWATNRNWRIREYCGAERDAERGGVTRNMRRKEGYQPEADERRVAMESGGGGGIGRKR